jgi:uncharacterized membrane protein
MILVIITYVALFTVFSYLRYVDFYTGNWDLGINIQEMWSTTHGMLMYEAGDYENYFTTTHLEIHTTLIAIPFAYLYAIFPTPATLFVMESLFTASAIIPIYLITSRITDDGRLIYGTMLVYLFSVGIISSLLDDFHWMTLIPVEYLFFFYFLWQKKPAISLIPFVAGIFTEEVFPILAASIILYFAFSRWSMGMFAIHRRIREREWLLYLGYLILCGVSFLFLRYLQTVYFPTVFNNQIAVPYLKNSFDPFYNPLPSINSLGNGLVYWIFLYGSFAFLPFFHKKHFIMAAPWIYETVFVLPNYSGLGNQYAFIGVPPLVIGFIFGINKLLAVRDVTLTRILRYFSLGILAVGASLVVVTAVIGGFYFVSLGALTVLVAAFVYVKRKLNIDLLSPMRVRITADKPTLVTALMVMLIMANVLISPVGHASIGAEQYSGGYAFGYWTNAEFQYASELASAVGHNGQVLASENLFPLVAEDNYAYSLASQGTPSEQHYYGLPFNATSLPHFIFIDQWEMGSVPQFILSAILNASVYGLRGTVQTNISYPGNIYLYELGYAGPAVVYKT